MILTQPVYNSGNKTCHVDGPDVGFNELAKLLGDCPSCMPNRKRFRRIEVKEDGDKDNGYNHPKLLFRVYAVWIVLGL